MFLGKVILVWPVLSPLGKKAGHFLFDHEPKAMHGFGVPCPELGGGPLVASWNQVGRIDLTPVCIGPVRQ